MTSFTRLKSPMDVVGVFLRHVIPFSAVALLTFAAVVAYTMTRVPLYESTSRIAIDVAQQSPVGPDSAAPAKPDDGLVEMELGVLRSRPVAEAVVDALGLDRDPEFTAGTKKPAKRWTFVAVPQPAANLRKAAVDSLMEDLVIARDDEAPVLTVQATSRNPDKAARIANAVADQFLALGSRSKRSVAGAESTILDRQLTRLGDDVRKSDAALAWYRAAHGLTGGVPSTGTALDQQTAALAASLAVAQSDAATAQAKAQEARAQIATGRPDAVAEVLQSPVVTDLRKQRETLATSEADLEGRYGQAHPQVALIKRQIASIDAGIAAEEDRIATGLESNAASTAERASRIGGQLQALRAQQSSSATASVEADSLARVAEARRSTYVQLAQSATRSAQERELDVAPGRLLVAAVPADRPSYPHKSLLLLVGGIGSLALAILVTMVLEMFDSRVRTAEEIHGQVGVRHLASIDHLSRRTLRSAKVETGPWDYVLARPMSSFVESIRSLRTRLMMTAIPECGTVVCVTSAVSNEGKSVLSASLARTMALSGDRVLIIDCDLRRNGLAGLLKNRPQAGLREVLNGSCAVDEAIVRDAVSGVDIIPLAAAKFLPEDVFSDGRMELLLGDMRSRYDFIVLDAPPVLIVDEAARLGRLADKVLLAVRWGSTRWDALRVAVDRLQECRVDLLGIVLTAVNPRMNLALGYRDPHYYQSISTGYHLN